MPLESGRNAGPVSSAVHAIPKKETTPSAVHASPKKETPSVYSPLKNENIPAAYNNNSNSTFFASQPKYTLDEIVLSEKVKGEIDNIVKTAECRKKVFEEWNLKSTIKEKIGIFVNLYGVTGTGKTMTAHGIVSTLEKKIICLNYADTEFDFSFDKSKKLKELFEYAKENDAVIFIDEADAFLAKRSSNMSNPVDVTINHTKSILRSILNDYDGTVIFATNHISNYDAAFMRRIQYHIKFDLPDLEMRKQLWEKYIPEEMPNDIDVSAISEKYPDICGGEIADAVVKAAVNAVKNGEETVKQVYFEEVLDELTERKNAIGLASSKKEKKS